MTILSNKKDEVDKEHTVDAAWYLPLRFCSLEVFIIHVYLC